MFGWLRWQPAKMDLALSGIGFPPRSIRVRHRKHRARVGEFPPDTDAYVRMAAVWDRYAHWFVPPYGSFIVEAGRRYALPINTVLDLACGTGLLSRQAARRVQSVVGLDASEAMLEEARSRTRLDNVRYVRGDFRDFRLNETFDAALCGSDSLNYVETPGEVAAVFRCVREHLRPGGLFAFDTLDDRFFRHLAHRKVVVEMKGEEFEIYFFYDPARRVSESRVVFEGVVERHRRVPIEAEDVRRAAAEAGLVVDEHFSSATYLLLLFTPARQFYLLRRPGS